jgi:flagellin-like protein
MTSKRKGLSPLIASVILIAITVLIAGIIMTWMSTLTKSQQHIISNRTEESVGCIGVIEIMDVYVDFSTNKSRVFVTNTGGVENIVSGKVLSTRGSEAGNITAFPVAINKGDITVLEFNMSGAIANCSVFSKAMVSTRCVTDTWTRLPNGC